MYAEYTSISTETANPHHEPRPNAFPGCNCHSHGHGARCHYLASDGTLACNTLCGSQLPLWHRPLLGICQAVPERLIV